MILSPNGSMPCNYGCARAKLAADQPVRNRAGDKRSHSHPCSAERITPQQSPGPVAGENLHEQLLRPQASAHPRGPFSWVGQKNLTKEQHISEPRINDRIRVPEVRLVGPSGEQVGVVRVEDALRLAAEADLDLVEVAPNARPPVAKLMDYGKYKYESDQKARDARRKQANTVLKEIRFRLKIDEHDYETKKGHVVRFLKGGDKVKVMIMFRGREQSRPEMGMRLLQRLAEDVEELGHVESVPRQDGRNMTMVLAPEAKKTQKTSQQRRDSEARQQQKDQNDAATSA